MKKYVIAAFVAVLSILVSQASFGSTLVTLQTPFGDVEIELFDEQAPLTVANFLSYVNDGDFQNTFIHRSATDFVIQGGGYTFMNGYLNEVPAHDPVVNEAGISNQRGTIAMAKQSGDPDSATSQWYINLADNSEPLDVDNGGYTVFGQVLDDGMDIIDQIAALDVWAFADPFGSLPLIDYPGDVNVTREHLVMTDVVVKGSYQLNEGYSGAWFYPETTGQGSFIDIDTDSKFIFLSWFTYTMANSGSPNEQQWYTAQGQYVNGTANLVLYETVGGEFDSTQETTTTPIGEATILFEDCRNGLFSYSFDDGSAEGAFPVQRVIPGSENVCDEKSDGVAAKSGDSQVLQAVDINPGMDGSWYDPETNGQGFFIDTHESAAGDGFIFVSWFTYGSETGSGQRWLTAQGAFDGSEATIDVYETTGGSFDQSTAVETIPVGTMTIGFEDCGTATLSYSIPEEGLANDLELVRVMSASGNLCEEVSGGN